MNEKIAEALAELIESTFYSINLFGMGLVAYILEALALYTIAKRRGIKKSWLSWIPVVNVWILGSLSDQYRYVTRREVKNRRKWLLGLKILEAVLVVAMIVLLVVSFVNAVDWNKFAYGVDEDYLSELLIDIFGNFVGATVVALLLRLLLVIATIMIWVLRWVCIYDILRSCDPQNNKVYFWVSLGVHLVGVSGLESIFLLICMNKDGGMPPRKQENPAPGYIPPVEKPRDYQPEQNGPEF